MVTFSSFNQFKSPQNPVEFKENGKKRVIIYLNQTELIQPKNAKQSLLITQLKRLNELRAEMKVKIEHLQTNQITSLINYSKS